MADEIENAIIENAQGPAKATGDSGSMEQHPFPIRSPPIAISKVKRLPDVKDWVLA
jgi:hypothetical protein